MLDRFSGVEQRPIGSFLIYQFSYRGGIAVRPQHRESVVLRRHKNPNHFTAPRRIRIADGDLEGVGVDSFRNVPDEVVFEHAISRYSVELRAGIEAQGRAVREYGLADL